MRIESLFSTLQGVAGAAYRAVFPRSCLVCERFLSDDLRDNDSSRGGGLAACPECWQILVGDVANRCGYCHASRRPAMAARDRCGVCSGSSLHFRGAVAVGDYQGCLQAIVLEMKARRDEVAAFQLGRMLRRVWQSAERPDLDVIIPVPIHWRKRLRRGVNLAAVIAEGYRRECGWPIIENALQLTRATSKQGTLSTPQRIENLRGAFSVTRPNQIAERRLLVVDDVMTSGATLAEASRVLLKAGAREVWAGVVARGARLT